MLDYELQKRLTVLLEAATDKRKASIDPETLREIKQIVRSSDEFITSAFDILMERLRANHPQARLHAVSLCDELFMRSKSFRASLSAALDVFLEHSVGPDPSRPLPGPRELASALRATAVRTLQGWNKAFGLYYPQVSYSCRYLSETLQLEASAGPGGSEMAPEDEARRARTQTLLRERFRSIEASWDRDMDNMRTLLQQLDGSLQLLGDLKLSSADSREQLATQGTGGELLWQDADDEDLWDEEEDEQEGLGAYAVEVAPTPPTADASGDPVGTREEVRASGSQTEEVSAVLETVSEAGRLLEESHLARITGSLKVLTRVTFEELTAERALNARRQQLLKEAVDARAAAQAAVQRARDAGARVAGPRRGQEATPGPAGDSEAGPSCSAEDQETFEVTMEEGGGTLLAVGHDGLSEELEAAAQMQTAEQLLISQLSSARRHRRGRGRGRSRGAGGRRAVASDNREPGQALGAQRAADRAHNERCMAAGALEDLPGTRTAGGGGLQQTPANQKRKKLTLRQRLNKKIKTRK